MAFNGFVSPVVIQIHPTLAKLRKFFSKSSEVVRLIAKHFFTRSGSFHWEVFARELSATGSFQDQTGSFWDPTGNSQHPATETIINFQPFQGFFYASPMNVKCDFVSCETGRTAMKLSTQWLAEWREKKNTKRPENDCRDSVAAFLWNFAILPSLSNRKFRLNFKDDDDKRRERMFWEGIWESFRVVKTRRKKQNTNSIWNMFLTIKFRQKFFASQAILKTGTDLTVVRSWQQ